MGRGTGHDAALAPGRGSAGSAADRVARPPACGQEAGARDRLQPPAGQAATTRERAAPARRICAPAGHRAPPAEAGRSLPMLDPHTARSGRAPRQTAADGGYASRANLTAAKARGVADVAFHKKCGIAVADMVKSLWVYRRLRNFRAGIEAGISCFKCINSGLI